MSSSNDPLHRNTGHTPGTQPTASSTPAADAPHFAQYSEEEASKHESYLLVTTVRFATQKGTFLTNIEWCSSGSPSGSAQPGTARSRMLVEREPIGASQARDKARTLALRYRVPVVLVVER